MTPLELVSVIVSSAGGSAVIVAGLAAWLEPVINFSALLSTI